MAFPELFYVLIVKRRQIERFKKWLRVCIKTEKLFFFVAKSAEIHEPPPLPRTGPLPPPPPHQRRNFAYT